MDLLTITETQAAIYENAAYHTQLLNIIANLQNVPSELKRQSAQVDDLRREVSEIEEKVVELAKITKKERKEHENLRNAKGIKLVHTLMRKKSEFEERESKEEREYVEALRREISERDKLEILRNLLENAQHLHTDLEDRASQYKSAKIKLADLYERIFEGPTEDFPEDDDLEYSLNEIRSKHEELRATLSAEVLAVEHLGQALKVLKDCQSILLGARLSKGIDWVPNKQLTDTNSEKNVLRKAESKANEADTLVKQARNISHRVRPLRKATIIFGTVVGDLILNQAYWKHHFDENLRKSIAQVEFVSREVNGEYNLAKRRACEAEERLAEVSKQLANSQEALDSFRRTTFENYLKKHPPPPDYNPLCDYEIPQIRSDERPPEWHA